MTFDQLTSLSAVFTFSSGGCYGGSPRWIVHFMDDSDIQIYYGSVSSSYQDCVSNLADPKVNQSGLNMIKANFDGIGDDVRYERSDHSPSFYTTYADAAIFAAGKTIKWIAFTVDSGWKNDQVINLGFVTVNDNTFVPQSGGFTPVCPTDPATIQVSKVGAAGQLTIDEDVLANGPDTGKLFRMVDCKYMYNISGKSLGTGQYVVDAIINGVPATQVHVTKFALK
jgi:hypothetical protein